MRLEKVFRGSEASGIPRGIGEAGDFEKNGIGGTVSPEAGCGFDAGFSQAARQAQHACQGANAVLLLRGKSCEGAVPELGVAAALVANAPGQNFPFRGRP